MHTSFTGVWVPIVTPFLAGDAASIDHPALARLAQHLAEQGISGLVVAATTGEGILLQPGEQDALLATLREVDNSGRTVLAPGFDRESEEPVPDAVALSPELSTVIVEGNYLLLDDGGWEAIAPLLHATVGIVVDDAIRRERLIARHIAFGKAPDAARAWALGPDERNAAAIAATLERADYLLSP